MLARIGPSDVVPQDGWVIIVDQLPVLVVAVIRISVSRSVQFMDVRFAIHGIVPEGPVDDGRIVQPHLHALCADALRQLARDVPHRAAIDGRIIGILTGEQAKPS